MNIAFSIIIPLYNKSRTITQTLDSVCSLAWDHYEVVVVDDGSTDDSPEIVNSYPSKRIKLYRKTNGGVSSARNYGAQKACNPWLIFLDADDLLFPESLKIFADMIERHPQDQIFAGNYQRMKKGKMVSNKCENEFVSVNPHRDIWYRRFYLRPGAFCCSEHAFKISGGYDERMNYQEDMEYCMRLASLFRVVVSPKLVMEYVTEESEARVKVHPLNKNFSFYLPCMNVSDRYLGYKYYSVLCGSIRKYCQANEQEAVRILSNIKKEKFNRWFQIGYKLNLRINRLFDK